MTEAPALPLYERPIPTPPAGRDPQPHAPVLGEGNSRPIVVLAPDRYCAELLLEAADKLFPAEIASGSRFVVRLHPPPGGEQVLAVLSLVEGWLESIPLPCTKVFCGDNGYLIRASTGPTRPVSTVR